MVIRLIIFGGLLVLFVLWESFFPRRQQGTLLKNRICNLSLSLINSLIVFILPINIAVLAMNAGNRGFLYSLSLPFPVHLILSLLLLDMVIYFQHLMFHSVPLLWQLHKVHHADRTLNATSAVRFHPVEIFISLGIKVSAVLLIGVPASGVILFEIILNGCSLFNHSCIQIPLGADRVLRFFLVTPDMHRIHHSVRLRETNRNFGFCLTWWDFIFGTYRQNPVQDQKSFLLGLSGYTNGEDRSILKSLLMPFDGKAKSYSIKGMGKQGA
ncbi:sterol desaturase family protein [Oceanispirochaeta crateris]|nr:sterol desaturase family protein [Oceanispirochaeta crateris]